MNMVTCKLCGNILDNFSDEFVLLGKVEKEMLGVVLYQLNFSEHDNPVICQTCKKYVHKFFKFKSTCIETEVCLYPYMKESGDEVNLKNVYIREKLIKKSFQFEETDKVCRFCLSLTRSAATTGLKSEILKYEQFFREFMPELDLETTGNAFVCESCHVFLEEYAKFVKFCLEYESKILEKRQKRAFLDYENCNKEIQKERESAKTSPPKVEIFLNLEHDYCLPFNRLENYNNAVEADEVEIEYESKLIEKDQKRACQVYENCNEDIEKERGFVKNSSPKFEKLYLNMEHDYCLPFYTLDNGNDNIKTEDHSLLFSKLDSCASSIKTEEVEIKSYEEGGEYSLPVFNLGNSDVFLNIQDVKSDNESQSGTFGEGMDQKEKISPTDSVDMETVSVTQEESSANGVSIVAMPEEISKSCKIIRSNQQVNSLHFEHMFDSIRSYQIDNREVGTHTLTHEGPSKVCGFRAQENDCNTNILIHKDKLEIELFKCEICSYETKLKCCLKSHMLIHKIPSEIKMFKCEICNYEAKRKRTLLTHMLTHKKPSEIEIFKCASCTFKTKRKYRLKIHMLIHKTPSEIEMFKCEICTYETKQKPYLKRHMLVHKKPSEIEMFKCEMCFFETKRNTGLKMHMLIHKKSSEIEMLKCEFCTFETKRKPGLKIHMLIHKKPSEFDMFKCEFCIYETRNKYYFKIHVLNHNKQSEIEMFKCEMCTYETKYKGYLKSHMVTHKHYTYKAKRKSSLIGHMLIRKKPSEIEILQYETMKRKSAINSCVKS